MCLMDFHLARSGEGVHGLWRHVYTTGLLVQVGWVEGRVGTTDIVLVDLVGFLTSGPSIGKCCSIQCHSKHVCVGTSKAAGRAGSSGSV